MASSYDGIPESEVPVLGEENIIICIKDYINVPLTVNELRKPTQEKLQTILGSIVCKMLQVSNEQMTQIPLHFMETMSHQDLQIEEGAGVILFVKAISYFLEKCGIRDFSLTDIVHPTKKRTRKILSAVVNFIQYIGAYRDPVTSEIISKIEIRHKKEEEYKQRREELQSRIAHLKKERSEKQRAVNELNIQALEDYSEELEKVKKEKVESTSRTEAEVEELRNLLLITHAKRLNQEAQSEVDCLKKRTNAMIVKENSIVTFSEEVTPSALKLIHAINDEAIKVQVHLNELGKLEDTSIEVSQDFKNILAEMQNLQSAIAGKQERKAHTVDMCNKLKKYVYELEQALSDKQDKVEKKLKSISEENSKINNEISEIEQLIYLQTDEHNLIMNKLNDGFVSLKAKLVEYNNFVIKGCE